MILNEEFQALIDLTEVKAAEEEWRRVDAACLPHFESVNEADRAVRMAEHTYRQLIAPAPFRVVSKEERDAAIGAIEKAREAKAKAETDLLAAQDLSRKANDAIAAAKARAWGPVLDKAIEDRIALAAKVDVVRAELAQVEAESKRAGDVIIHAVQNGAKLPCGYAAVPLLALNSETMERSIWGRSPKSQLHFGQGFRK
jgi:hypothetical protein